MKLQSSTNILDSRSECSTFQALNTGKGVGGAEVDSDDPNAEAAIKRQVGMAYKSCSGDNGERGAARSVSDDMAWNRANVEASPADSPISDRFGDDRFTDNILRALDGLPQHGDDEEERDAAEEGALIEASGYQDPKFESNGRY